MTTDIAFPIALRRRSAPQPELATRTAARMVDKIPSAFRDCARLDIAAARLSYPADLVTRAAHDIFAGRLRTVTVHGLSGAGKTTGAALLVGELSRLAGACYAASDADPLCHSLAFWDSAVEWCASDDLASEADYADPRDGEPELARRMRVAPVAVIDDLGNERGRTAGANNVPLRILQARYNFAELVTIVTCGLTSKEIEARWGVGIARRLADTNNPMHRIIGPARGAK
jgi:hypothetical protein